MYGQRTNTAPSRTGRLVGAPSRSTAWCTSSWVSGATFAFPLSTRDTVAIDTPASAAIARTVGLGICYTRLFHTWAL
ncbi:hypothetical protein GCM10029964_072470 [Kibdelosporangium lantanae]